MAWIYWKLVLSMHVKWLWKMTKFCEKLLNQTALLQDKKRAKESLKACGKKKNPLQNRFQVEGNRRAHAQ